MTHVLIVNDKPENLYLLRVLLQSHDCRVTEARHGAEALVKARQDPPGLIISDLLMPVMDGYTLLRHWKMDERLKAIPFVVFTATYTEPKDERLALDLGADAFILKPTEPEPFMARIREVVRKGEKGELPRSHAAAGTEKVLLQEYSEVLIRKLEEKALQLQQQYATLQGILESAASPIYSLDTAFRYSSFNRCHATAMQENYGVGIEIGKKILDYLPPGRERQRAEGNLRQVLDGKPLVEEAYTGGQGAPQRYYEVAYNPIRGADDTVVGVAVMARDLTERKQAEEALRRSEALLRQTQEITRVGGWDFDVATSRFTWTDEVYRIYEVPRDYEPNLLEKETAFYADEDRAQLDAAFRRAMEQGTAYDLELRVVTAKGRKIWVRTVGHVERRGAQVVRVYGNIMDITERRRLEAQLRQSQKMEAIGHLAAGVAHDFNNLLTVVQLETSILSLNSSLDAESRDATCQIAKAADRAANLTRQLLAFSRKQEKESRLVNLPELVAGMARFLERILGEDIVLKTEIASGLPPLLGDPGMIEQVIMNLAVNSRDAMSEGGQLDLAVGEVTLGASAAGEHPEGRPGRFLCLAVRDTGTGIAAENRTRIFEPFFTTKEAGKGTGLGLATVLGIVKQHDGWIEVAGEPGQGAIFQVFLPAAPAASAQAPGAALGAKLKGGSETILVVEDDAAIRRLLHVTLERFGYRVLVAGTSAEAVELLARDGGPADLLLTDFVMPGGTNGWELAKSLQATHPALKVVYISGYTKDSVSQDPLLQPGVNFLHKPFSIPSVLEIVRRRLDLPSKPPAR